ncbi:MAG: hypothetical protein J7K31_03795 [Candidatus Aenigmarchaeota archaeon]|nr:hypothetical protein [Candidatus Aenigmarchaeota archaeon]
MNFISAFATGASSWWGSFWNSFYSDPCGSGTESIATDYILVNGNCYKVSEKYTGECNSGYDCADAGNPHLWDGAVCYSDFSIVDISYCGGGSGEKCSQTISVSPHYVNVLGNCYKVYSKYENCDNPYDCRNAKGNHLWVSENQSCYASFMQVDISYCGGGGGKCSETMPIDPQYVTVEANCYEVFSVYKNCANPSDCENAVGDHLWDAENQICYSRFFQVSSYHCGEDDEEKCSGIIPLRPSRYVLIEEAGEEKCYEVFSIYKNCDNSIDCENTKGNHIWDEKNKLCYSNFMEVDDSKCGGDQENMFIKTTKPRYSPNDIVEVYTKLPGFMDCKYYFISPSGEEIKLGEGGCLKDGISFSRPARLPEGDWKVKVIAWYPNNPTEKYTLVNGFEVYSLEKCTLYAFYEKGCSHCGREWFDFLEQLKANYPNLDIKIYEISENENNMELFDKMLTQIGENLRAVPCSIIEDEAFFGFSENINNEIENAVKNSCKEEIKCTDSDGGKNYYNEGVVTLSEGGRFWYYYDRCVIPSTDPNAQYYFDYNGTKFVDVDECNGDDCYIGEAYCNELGNNNNKYILELGESVEYDGKIVKLVGVDSAAIRLSVDDKLETIRDGDTKTINGVKIKVEEIFCIDKKEYKAAVLKIGDEIDSLFVAEKCSDGCKDGACIANIEEINNFRLEDGYYVFDIYFIFKDFYIDGVKVEDVQLSPMGGSVHTLYKIPCKEGKLLEAVFVNPVSGKVTVAYQDISSYSCGNGKCIPKDHKECRDGDVWWVDSCGNIERLADNCLFSEDCKIVDGEAQCVPKEDAKTCSDLGFYRYGTTEYENCENDTNTKNVFVQRDDYGDACFKCEKIDDGKTCSDYNLQTLNECEQNCSGTCQEERTLSNGTKCYKCVSGDEKTCEKICQSHAGKIGCRESYNDHAQVGDDECWTYKGYTASDCIGGTKCYCYDVDTNKGCVDSKCTKSGWDNSACIGKGEKDLSKYSSKQAFLISDEDWRDVLSLVPVAVWTDGTGVKKYPLLIYHREGDAFDADSIIHFFQQYEPDNVKIIGESPKELDNLLVASPELGAGLDSGQIQRISTDDYLSYWKYYGSAVYVEDDYTLALVASIYASLINVPLIIEDTSLDKDGVFEGKYVICVGNVGRNCDEQYSLDQLEKKYVSMTNTDKIILTNPSDLNIRVTEDFTPDKSIKPIQQIYSKTSLAAPILASAKHEIIFSITQKDYEKVSHFISSKIQELMPYIINNPKGIKDDNSDNPLRKIFKENTKTGKVEDIAFANPLKIVPSRDSIVFSWHEHLFNYDISNSKITKFDVESWNFDFSSGKILYNEKLGKQCILRLIDINTGKDIDVGRFEGGCKPLAIEDDYIVWVEEEKKGSCRIDSSISCSSHFDCVGKYCSKSGKSCVDSSDCDQGEHCREDYCQKNEQIYLKDLNTGKIKKIENIDHIDLDTLDISNDKVVWEDNQGIKLYFISSDKKEIISESGHRPKIYGNKIVFIDEKKLYLYDITKGEKTLLQEGFEEEHFWNIEYGIDDNKVFWRGTDGIYSYNIKTEQVEKLSNTVNAKKIVLVGDNLFYVKEEINQYYIYGFLTIFAAPNAIQFRTKSDVIGAGKYRALDPTEYADIYLDDGYPDMSVGRIQGITLSDVSSYVARDLFYQEIGKTNRMVFIARSFDYDIKLSHEWTKAFEEVGYDAECSIQPTKTVSVEKLCCDVDKRGKNWPKLWKKRDLISYMDHGSSRWAGIKYSDIPYLENSIVYNDACSTCSTFDHHSFCNNVIRKGGLGHIGAVCIAYTGNTIYKDTMVGIYKEDMSLGEAFAKSYVYDEYKYMTTLLGDPTLDLNPTYNLKEELPWRY